MTTTAFAFVVLFPIVDKNTKLDELNKTLTTLGLTQEDALTVGDGANDALMLERAGLGIAFHAKPTLRERADTAISAGGLDSVLYLLGLTAREIKEIS